MTLRLINRKEGMAYAPDILGEFPGKACFYCIYSGKNFKLNTTHNNNQKDKLPRPSI
jgi:hypothetical protein